MKKFISAVSAAALLLTSIPALNTVSEVSAEEDDTIKIMCIGDSITDGYTYDYVGSYRKFIYHNLTEKGYNIDMVGSKDGGWTPTYTDEETGETWEFDNENTGYSGYAIKEYSGRSGIYETLISTDCLAQTQPDIVTLQIGTNDIIDNHDINGAGERLEILVDYILDNIPQDATLFISSVPLLDPNRSDVYDWFGNYRHSADWSEQYDDDTAREKVSEAWAEYNTQVIMIATKKQQEGKNVVLSEAAWEITDVAEQLFDGVHPNNVGYKAMGNYWAELIDNYLSGSQGETTTVPTTTETTATATTTETATSSVSTITTTTTTTTGSGEEVSTFKIGDLVKLCYYILDYPDTFTEEDVKKYDLNSDGRTDVFDVPLMRSAVVGNVESILEKRKEKDDESYLDLSGAVNIIINPEDYEPKLTNNSFYGSRNSSIIYGNSDNSEVQFIKWETDTLS